MRVMICKPLQVFSILYIISYITGTIAYKILLDVYTIPKIPEILLSILGFIVKFAIIYILCRYKYIRTAWNVAVVPYVLLLIFILVIVIIKTITK